MNRRLLIGIALVILCVGLCVGVFVQQGQLSDLRVEQQRQVAQLAALASQPTEQTQVAESSATSADSSAAMSELLRLRSQATQLAARKRELAGVQGENERLHAQLASRSTNSPAGSALPPGYIRRKEAQWVGLNTPENTMQSFLWAIQNQDVTSFLRTLTPESAQKMLPQGGDPEAVRKSFKEASIIPGLRVVNQEPQPDGSIEAQLEIVPGQSSEQQKVRFRQIDGEWKIDMR